MFSGNLGEYRLSRRSRFGEILRWRPRAIAPDEPVPNAPIPDAPSIASPKSHAEGTHYIRNPAPDAPPQNDPAPTGAPNPRRATYTSKIVATTKPIEDPPAQSIMAVKGMARLAPRFNETRTDGHLADQRAERLVRPHPRKRTASAKRPHRVSHRNPCRRWRPLTAHDRNATTRKRR